MRIPSSEAAQKASPPSTEPVKGKAKGAPKTDTVAKAPGQWEVLAKASSEGKTQSVSQRLKALQVRINHLKTEIRQITQKIATLTTQKSDLEHATSGSSGFFSQMGEVFTNGCKAVDDPSKLLIEGHVGAAVKDLFKGQTDPARIWRQGEIDLAKEGLHGMGHGSFGSRLASGFKVTSLSLFAEPAALTVSVASMGTLEPAAFIAATPHLKAMSSEISHLNTQLSADKTQLKKLRKDVAVLEKQKASHDGSDAQQAQAQLRGQQGA